MTSTPTAGSARPADAAVGLVGPTVPRQSWLALGAVLLALYLHLADVTAISVAIPSVQRDLSAPSTSVQWMLAGYTLPYALLLITGGRLGDAYGRRALVVAGVLGFTAASALCALAPTEGALVAGRIGQGMSAAMLAPQVMPIIMLLFPAAARGAAFGVHAAVIAIATTTGPLLGGLLVHADLLGLGWRVIFLVNLPIGVVAMAAAARWIPREDRDGGCVGSDPKGTLLVTVGLLMLIFPLVEGRQLGWPAWTVVMAVGSLPVLAALVPQQRRVERAGGSPLIPPALFRQRAYLAGAMANLLLLAGVAAFFLVVVVYLQQGLGFSAQRVGLMLMAFPFGAALASGASVPLARRLGRPMLQLGALLMAAGMGGLLAVVAPGGVVATWPVVGWVFVAGVGMGLLSPPLYNITLGAMARRDIGSASGVFATAGQTGNALGVAVLGTLFFGLASGGGASYAAALSWVLAVEVAVYLLVAVLLWLFLPAPGSCPHPNEPERSAVSRSGGGPAARSATAPGRARG